ncbi:MAG TPA: hypothetical protein PK523_13465, partial [Elusimicrobiales bacterium]|nr:hypothetical protein [Elusimicrobiales bacterium]
YGASGGGAGGTVHLITGSLTGGGTITAKGGNAGDDANGGADAAGGGGGGIVRVDPVSYISNEFTGTISVAGGARSPTAPVLAEDGGLGLIEAPLAVLYDNDAGQRANSLSVGDILGADLLGFKLVSHTQDARVNSVAVRLSAVAGVVDGDWAGMKIFEDPNGNGRRDTGENTQVGGAGTVNTAAGTITFTEPFVFPTTGMNYVMSADISNLVLGDTFRLDLSTANINAASPTNPTENALQFTGGHVTQAVHSVSNVIVWDGETGDGKWHTPDNWNPNVIPVEHSLVTINSNVTVTAEASQPGIQFNTLTLGNAGGTTTVELVLSTGVVRPSTAMTVYKNATVRQNMTYPV